MVMREYDVASREHWKNMLGVSSSTFDFAKQTSEVDERRFKQALAKVRDMDPRTGKPAERKDKDKDTRRDREREPRRDPVRDRGPPGARERDRDRGREGRDGKVCKEWLASKTCSWGKACKFAHPDDEGRPKRRREQDDGDRAGVKAERRKDKDKEDG